METLGIYIQIPFCASKCSFCNFSSRVQTLNVFDAYCRGLTQEIERLPDLYEAQGIGKGLLSLTVDTVYLGGGTPSLLGAERLETIMGCLARRFHFKTPLEFTLEVTPGSADGGLLASARKLLVNRLSIGAQSFDDGELRAVGRLHSAADTGDLVRGARRAGFANINLDLIAGLPYQTEASWLRSLEQVARLRPEHVSIYLFEVDEKSRLGREVLEGGDRYHAGAVPEDDFMADAYVAAREFLTREGYVQYEISNFALPGYESRHNRKYWRLEPYVGIGAGAHSFDGRLRWANEVAVESYEEKLFRGHSPIAEIRALSTEEQLEEFFFLGLREREGIDLVRAENQWGVSRVRRHEARIADLVRDGWVEHVAGRVRITDRALLVSNEIFQEFLAQ